MIAIYVPKDTPLTLAEHAIVTFAVLTDDDREVVGCYPSLQRAVEYITDWIMAGDPPITIPVLEKINGVCWKFGIWTIQKTDYRV